MAKDQKNNGGNKGNGEVSKIYCCAEDCKKPTTRAEFCEEHFAWFKEGLITKSGQKPRDFDKKYQAYTHRRKSA